MKPLANEKIPSRPKKARVREKWKDNVTLLCPGGKER